MCAYGSRVVGLAVFFDKNRVLTRGSKLTSDMQDVELKIRVYPAGAGQLCRAVMPRGLVLINLDGVTVCFGIIGRRLTRAFSTGPGLEPFSYIVVTIR